MMLPEGARQFNKERKLREESQKLNDFQKHAELIRNLEVTSSSTTTTAKTSRVSDVEYDEEFEETIKDDLFNEIPSMALKAAPQTARKLHYEVPEVRDFSIDVWNGSPGLKYWGYNESNHDE